MAKAAPDGYTIFLATSSALSAVPVMRKQPPYDPVTAFTPITKIGTYSYFLFAHPSVPGRNVGELIEYIRANPGKVNYAGATTAGVMAAVELSGFAKLDMVRIPYKGEGPATLDLVSGRVQLMFATPTNALPAAKEGRLKVLAALMPKRSPLSPDTPTMVEAGAPNLSIVPWGGFVGPAGMPPEIVARLNREITAILARPEVREQMERQAIEVQSSTPAELGAHVKAQLEMWRKAVRDSGLAVEIIAKQSPPTPVDPASTTHCTAQAATAASMACPPAFRISTAVSVAAACEVAAMPWRATASDRPGSSKLRI